MSELLSKRLLFSFRKEAKLILSFSSDIQALINVLTMVSYIYIFFLFLHLFSLVKVSYIPELKREIKFHFSSK